MSETISDFVSGKGAKKIVAAEKIIDNAEFVNETICNDNALEKERLTEKEKLVEAVKRDLNKTAQAQRQQEDMLKKAADNIKANDKRLQQGFARLKVRP